MPVSQKSRLRGLEVTRSCPISSKEKEDPPPFTQRPPRLEAAGRRERILLCPPHPYCAPHQVAPDSASPPPTLAPHLLQSVARQLAARAEDRTMVLGCELLQLCPELLLLFRDHSECAHLSREEPCGRSVSPTPPPTPTARTTGLGAC